MHAVVRIAGRQYRVGLNQRFQVNHLGAQVGDEIIADEVLLVSDDSLVDVGQPLANWRVALEVVGQGRTRKIISYHFKRRGGRRRTHGSRRQFTTLKVKSIEKVG